MDKKRKKYLVEINYWNALSTIYRRNLSLLEKMPIMVEKQKTWIAEEYAILKKRNIFNSVTWSKMQQEEFDNYWKNNYGKKIPNKWHKLYQAANGEFCLNYIPEKIFTTKIEPLLNDAKYCKVLMDKSLVEVLSKGYCMVPKTALIRSGGIYFDGDRKPISEKQANSILSHLNNVVIKKTIGSSSGRNILFIDNNKVNTHDIIKKMGTDFICQEKINQHKSLAIFNDSSINTIRITTYIVDGEMHHFPIALRMGRKGKRIDNIHAGGIVVGVRDDGSFLSTGYELGYGDKIIKYNCHPDSGVIFENEIIAFIPKIINAAYLCHRNFPHVGIISWDFTVDEQENIVLIEANLMAQSIWFPQIIHGKGAFGEQTERILSLIRK